MSAGLIVETVGTTTFGFDFDGQYIEVDAGSEVLYVSDLWAAIKAAQWTTRGWENGQIARGGGLDGLGEVSGDQIESFLTITLLEDWELKSLKTGGKFTVTGGNLIKENGLDPFVDNPLITHFLFLSQAGTVARVSVGSAVTPTDKTEIATATRDLILSDHVPFQGARIDAAVTSIAAATRDQILSDGHAFPGARIDAAISSVDGGLTEAQAAALTELQTRIAEVWGSLWLDRSKPVTVTTVSPSVTSFTFGGITVTMSESGAVKTMTRQP